MFIYFIFSFIEVEKIIHKILFVSIFISLLEPFIKLIFDFKNLYKVYEQYKLRNDPSYNDYCQKEANSIFEPPKFELTEFYFDAILIFVIGTFGSAFYPPCFIITFVALFLLYWYFKYLVLYRCQVEPVKDENFFYYFMRILTLSPLFFNFGIYFNAKKLFDSQNEDERNLKPYFYCLLTISLLLIIVNLFQFRKIIYIKMKRNESTFDQVKEKYQNKNYSQIQAIFKTK